VKAALSVSPGGPESVRVETVDAPTPGPGEVRINVHTCGVNYSDLLFVADRYQLRPLRPFTPGGEVSGVVDAVGQGVPELAVGDRVLAIVGWGGMAEKLVAPAGLVIQLSDRVPLGTAAALIFTFGTAWHALRDRAHLQPGETLLVLGAGGGVGQASVQLGEVLGARVVAAASTSEKATAAGAANTVVYPPGPFGTDTARQVRGLLREALGARGADVIVDPVGGDYTEPALRSLATGGRHLVLGFTAGIPKLPLNLLLLRSGLLVGVDWRVFIDTQPDRFRESCRELLDLCADGRIAPRIAHSFPLESAADGLALLARRGSVGKVVVTVNADVEEAPIRGS
jgi:NADPH2:quinone reductase